jgi:hypothetical protein
VLWEKYGMVGEEVWKVGRRELIKWETYAM